MALPDLIEIVPLEKPVRAEITVPGSKSITNRALILAALADGEVTLQGALWSEDTEIMFDCLQKLGFQVRQENDPAELCNRTLTVVGQGGRVPPGGTETQPLDLFVGNAGTAARFLAPFLCLGSGVYRLHGVARMHERPQAALFSALRELGYRVESENGNDKLPVKIWGKAESGKRKAETSCKVSIAESSQFASALLLSAKHGGWEIEIVGENADESPYVAMTSKLMEAFPKKGGTFQIEPDASSGSYFVGAGWLLNQYEFFLSREAKIELAQIKLSDVSVRLWPDSRWQMDEAFIELTRIGILAFDDVADDDCLLLLADAALILEMSACLSIFSRSSAKAEPLLGRLGVSPLRSCVKNLPLDLKKNLFGSSARLIAVLSGMSISSLLMNSLPVYSTGGGIALASLKSIISSSCTSVYPELEW